MYISSREPFLYYYIYVSFCFVLLSGAVLCAMVLCSCLRGGTLSNRETSSWWI